MSITLDLRPDERPAACSRCGTELPSHALACPVCAALVHRVELQRLAESAAAAVADGRHDEAREHWSNALAYLPPDSQQHAVISARLAELPLPLPVSPAAGAGQPLPRREGWRGAAGVATTIAVVVVSKLKFLLLGLTKASTFVSMFGFFAVYWGVYGWPLALGLVVSIYIHEMGHVAMLRRLGIDAGAPLFIPGVGALVMLKQRISDPLVDARIGLAGPAWGLGAAGAALALGYATGAAIWFAIAQLTAFLNLFNLIPVWQLDGARGFHALDRAQRWGVVAAAMLALWITGQRVLLLIAAVAVWRAAQKEAGPGDLRVVTTFVALVVSLAWLARAVGATP